MRSLPAPLLDLLLGAALVSLVLGVLNALGSAELGSDSWVLVPVGAGLFALRRGVRRAVLARAGAAPAAAVGEKRAPPGDWQEDPVRVLALAALAVLALVALAWWW